MELRNVKEAIRLGQAYEWKKQSLLYLKEALEEVTEEEFKKHLQYRFRALEEELKDLEYQIKAL
ncbi:hypothetical protein [Fusobacterium necrophorum]|uniref:hypothetical protein n=1 Tax=Fusobacterium necrophorum TaxID=859 RepID=UPI00255170DA|nr:hypothetical protein [Fusobacterium necrophorum]MDK4476159.1 hypothetical protein [Fusobacterium necrophorum]